MDWQAYAERLEADLQSTDENNKTLKQEVRDLQKKLIAAGTSTDAQDHLEKVKQESGSRVDAHIEKSNDLQQQLVAAQQARDAAIARAKEAKAGQQNLPERLKAASHELDAKNAEIQQLNLALNDQKELLQQACQALEARQHDWRAAAKSYEERMAVLDKQLKIQQKENGRLQGLSDQKRGQPFAEDEDDSEPEFPRLPAPATTKAPGQEKPHAAASKRPCQSPPNSTAAPLTGACPKLATVPSKAKPGPKPTAASKTAPKKAAPPVNPSAKSGTGLALSKPSPAEGRGLPVRTSVHESIAVADHSPPSRPVPAVSTTPNACKPSSATKPTYADQKKRKSSNQGPVLGAKRRRGKFQELQDELSELEINARGFNEPLAPRSRRKESYQEEVNNEDPSDDILAGSMDFHFKAICTYADPNTIFEVYHSTDLAGVAGDLWDRIAHLEGLWEKRWGRDWQHEFTKTGANPRDKYACVTRKSQHRRTDWGGGREAGMWACKDCVLAGLPCFTHTRVTGGKGEFQLLPLHEKDRVLPVQPDKEVRWWINAAVKLPESEDEMEY